MYYMLAQASIKRFLLCVYMLYAQLCVCVCVWILHKLFWLSKILQCALRLNIFFLSSKLQLGTEQRCATLQHDDRWISKQCVRIIGGYHSWMLIAHTLVTHRRCRRRRIRNVQYFHKLCVVSLSLYTYIYKINSALFLLLTQTIKCSQHCDEIAKHHKWNEHSTLSFLF